ncbi:MAG TPA: YbaK/EbsC family protein [Acidimicrobiales bacterium]|nr:YbaK/EbsC family protein [Acidimicrobiales bacterium]
MLGSLESQPAGERPELLAPVVAAALAALGLAEVVEVAAIDPSAADTAAFCARYGVAESASANCVVVEGRRGADSWLCACVVLATTRVDVNGLVRRHLEAKKASFAAMERAISESAMAYGGITPVGLPAAWPLLVDPAVVAAGPVVVGSGLRESKLVLDGALLAALPGAVVLEGLGLPR